MWKTKIYRILLEPPVHNTSFQSFQSRTKTEPAGILFTKKRQVIFGLGETKLVRLHPNFNYEMTFEMTLKRWEGGEKIDK
jgi:hypothetical protein